MTTKQVDMEALTAAAKVVGEAHDDSPSSPEASEVTLNNGVVLRIKYVPPFLIQRAATAIPRPEVPQVYLEDKDRTEANPDDPRYHEALQLWEAKTIEIGTNVLLTAGTEIVSVPPGVERPESDEWLSLLSFFGIEINRDSPFERYLAWLSCYAITDESDLVKLVQATSRRTGVAEEDAEKALGSFRNRAIRRASNGTSAKAD